MDISPGVHKDLPVLRVRVALIKKKKKQEEGKLCFLPIKVLQSSCLLPCNQEVRTFIHKVASESMASFETDN